MVSQEWMIHFTQYAETWPNHFLERMEKFTKLSDAERESNKKRSNEEPPVDLDNDTCFDTFSFNLTM